jgi:hypothetical protein
MRKVNVDEKYVLKIANSIEGVFARMATPLEDCGNHKADIILKYNNRDYYVQVSYTSKSKKQQMILRSRGTFFINTHRFKEIPLSEDEIIKNLESFLDK